MDGSNNTKDNDLGLSESFEDFNHNVQIKLDMAECASGIRKIRDDILVNTILLAALGVLYLNDPYDSSSTAFIVFILLIVLFFLGASGLYRAYVQTLNFIERRKANRYCKTKELWMILISSCMFLVAISPVVVCFVLPFIASMLPSPPSKYLVAQSDIRALEIAILQYNATCGHYPVPADNSVEIINEPEDDNYGRVQVFPVSDRDYYDKMIELLSCHSESEGGLYNARRIRFLALNETQKKRGKKYLDPWGSKFRVHIDMADVGYVKVGGKVLSTRVAVYSIGEDMSDDSMTDGPSKTDLWMH